MTKKDYIGFLFYIVVALTLRFFFDFFNEKSFYDAPFEICRVMTNHTYNEFYYGGLTNYLAMVFMYFLYGIGILAFAWPLTALIDKYIFKGYFIFYTNTNKIIVKIKNTNKIKITGDITIFEKVFGVMLILIAPPLIYDFLPLLVFEYDCFDLIKYKESLY